MNRYGFCVLHSVYGFFFSFVPSYRIAFLVHHVRSNVLERDGKLSQAAVSGTGDTCNHTEEFCQVSRYDMCISIGHCRMQNPTAVTFMIPKNLFVSKS